MLPQSNPIQSNPIQSNPIQSNPIQSKSILFHSIPFKPNTIHRIMISMQEKKERREGEKWLSINNKQLPRFVHHSSSVIIHHPSFNTIIGRRCQETRDSFGHLESPKWSRKTSCSGEMESKSIQTSCSMQCRISKKKGWCWRILFVMMLGLTRVSALDWRNSRARVSRSIGSWCTTIGRFHHHHHHHHHRHHIYLLPLLFFFYVFFFISIPSTPFLNKLI